jgi:prolyl-tRNA synthetase
LMGALIMTHSDDEGLVLPPRLAPIHVVAVPIYKTEEELQGASDALDPILASLKKAGLNVKFDNRDTHKPGFKFAEWELKGVPVRLAVGPRDLANGTVELARRDTKTKEIVPLEGLSERIQALLEEIQENLFQRAVDLRAAKSFEVNSWEEFEEVINVKEGFAWAHWDGTSETEEKIKELTKATIRCIPFEAKEEAGTCVLTGAPSKGRVVFAKAY